MKRPIPITMLELIQLVQRQTRTDDETVRLVVSMINRRRVVLCGNFAGQRIRG